MTRQARSPRATARVLQGDRAMAASHLRLICNVTSAIALPATLGALPVSAHGPGRPPKQVAPKLDAVLPLLNASVVRVRATNNLTGVRIADDLAVVLIPGNGPMPASFEVGLFGGWMPAQVERSDPAQRLVVLRLAGKREPAPKLAPADLPPGADFVVTAAGAGATLDIRTVWLEPDAPLEAPPGAAVFAVDGRFLGLATEAGPRRLLPAKAVLR